jgi:hypothetical protein
MRLVGTVPIAVATLWVGTVSCKQVYYVGTQALPTQTPDGGSGSDGGATSDGGVDGGMDGGVDGGLDAGVDGGSDAGVDAGFDGGADGGILTCTAGTRCGCGQFCSATASNMPSCHDQSMPCGGDAGCDDNDLCLSVVDGDAGCFASRCYPQPAAYQPLCSSDADCPCGSGCVQPPGGGAPGCIPFRSGPPCLNDGDCSPAGTPCVLFYRDGLACDAGFCNE